MKLCPKCGKSYERNWGVCFYCKTALVKAHPEPVHDDLPPSAHSPERAEHGHPSVSIFFYVGLLTLFTGLCIFSYQLYFYLKTGTWILYSFLDLMNWLKPNDPWILYPQDWRGLHQLMTYAPVSLVLIAIGAFIAKISVRHD